MMLYGSLQLFDILSSALSKSCLCLAIPLLSFFGCGIYLSVWQSVKNVRPVIFNLSDLPVSFHLCVSEPGHFPV